MDNTKRVSEAYKKTESREEKTQFYDSWSKMYDQEMNSYGYKGPAMTASAVRDLYPDSRDVVRILDVAAGTGFVGEELIKHGFVKVDALDPSQGMLDEAREKGVYQELICAYFDEKDHTIPPDTYDVIVVCGGCTNVHLPCSCLREAVRLLKPGGYFVMATRPFHLNTVDEYKEGRFENLMDEIEEEGKWKKIRKEILPGYHAEHEGIVFVYQKK
ncbi:methyltransferase-like protein 27 [Pecten maximus]|uniref:methyltransferase-like protein 27 n=1 Tax=Pecten maximus TaxID=6579 RepID=UPI0014580956|nr:methyltransferase-like protein 27 [Pecten maximus]XP_033762096.1 methyltransferase-like protein 27 [Pecten maximus]